MGEGAALGIDDGMAYSGNRQAGLRPGQIIAVGTDGIWESFNSAGEMFGKERFMAALQSHGDKTAREIVDGVVSDLNAFRGAELQSDDVTLVIVKISA